MSSSDIGSLVHDLQFGNSEAALNAAHALGRVGSPAVEPLLRAIGDNGMLQRLGILKTRGEWRDSDAGLLILELTKRVLESRGLMR